MEFTSVAKEVKMLIQRNDLKGAFQNFAKNLSEIHTSIDFTKERNNLIILKSQLAEIEEKEIKGTLNRDEINKERNKIRDSLLKILDERASFFEIFQPKEKELPIVNKKLEEDEIELKIKEEYFRFFNSRKKQTFCSN